MSSRILEELLSDNPWWSGGRARVPHTRRLEFFVLKHLVSRGRSVVLIGARRVGKTILALQLANAFAEEHGDESVIYVRGDALALYDNAISTALREFTRAVLRREYFPEDRPVLVIIDEAHYCRDWARQIKVELDRAQMRGARLIFLVTGSSALLIGREFAQHLTGRLQPYILYPLSLAELAIMRGLSVSRLVEAAVVAYAALTSQTNDSAYELLCEADAILSPIRSSLVSLLSEALTRGFMPEVCLRRGLSAAEVRSILEGYVSMTIYKDVIRAAEIEKLVLRRPGLLEDIVRIVAHRSPRVISAHEIARTLGVKVDTVELYLSLLTASQLVHVVRVYGERPEEIARKRKVKVMLVDCGIRNALLPLATRVLPPEEQGLCLENTILVHLKRLAQVESPWNDVYYWRENGREVDAVVRLSDKVLAVEVKRRPRGARGLIDFIVRHKSNVRIVVGEELRAKENYIEVPPHLALVAEHPQRVTALRDRTQTL